MKIMSALRPIASAVLLTVASLVPSGARGGEADVLSTAWTELHTSRIRLIAGHGKTGDGQYVAALEMILADGWKTYWRMPGDSGVPPSFDWTRSSNLAKAKPLYPAPVRMPEAGGTAIGYKGQLVLPIEITARDPAKPVALKLSLEFGLCRDICIPVSTSFDLVVPPGPAAAPPPQIAAALARVPRPQQSRRKDDPELKRAYVTTDGAGTKLVIEATFPAGDAGADAFVEAPEGFYVPIPTRVAADSKGSVRFEAELARDLAKDLKGKPLTITLVGQASGSSEVRWTMP